MKRAIVLVFVGCGAAHSVSAPRPSGSGALADARGAESAAAPSAIPTAPASAPAPAPASASASGSATPSNIPSGVSIGDIASPPTFDVKAIMTDALPKFQQCYATALKTTPDLRGKMLVRFVVNEAGTLTNVEEASSTTKDPKLFACIKDAIGGIKFPKPGGQATVNLPLRFRP